MFLARLAECNPWREDADAIGCEPEMAAWRGPELKWDPRASQALGDGGCVYSPRGPRRVGKTTPVRLDIEGVPGEVPAHRVLYCPFGAGGRPRDAEGVISGCLECPGHGGGGRRLVRLDGASGIRGWHEGIRRLRERGMLGNCTVVATGPPHEDPGRAAGGCPGGEGPGRTA